MSRTDYNRQQRNSSIVKYLEDAPYTTDEELAKHFNVSVNTIRLDRARLGIKELKIRLKEKAIENMKNITTISANEFVGDMIEYIPSQRAKSILKTTNNMTFEG